MGRVVNMASSNARSFGYGLCSLMSPAKAASSASPARWPSDLARDRASPVKRHCAGLTRFARHDWRVRALRARDDGRDEFLQRRAGWQAIKRVEAPDDLVGAISFLTSDDAAFITRARTLNGGWRKG